MTLTRPPADQEAIAAPSRSDGSAAAADRGLRRRMLAPLVVLLVAMTAYPTAYVLYLSLTSNQSTSKTSSFVGLGNYADLLRSAEFWDALRVTLEFTVLAVGVELALGLTAALALHGLRRQSHLLRAAILLPMAATPVAAMFGWKVLLDPTLGVLNYVLGGLFGITPDWLGTPRGALLTLVMVDVWQWTPFVMVILVGGLASLSQDVVEASFVDGARWYHRLRYVVVPHLAPYLVVALLFRVIDGLKTFDSIQVLTGGGPGSATTTLNMLAYRQGLQFLNFGRGASVAVVLLILAIVFGNVAIRTMRRGTYR